VTGSPKPTCRLCGAELKVYERPEGFCDDCLRSRQTQSLARVAKPETEANAGASRPKGGS
jgi:predicted amidophosphoribosyltransferase